jgi:predicted GNAT family acetyltransferase
LRRFRITMDETRVTHNQAADRFEITVEGQLAELTYRRDSNRLMLTHTFVPESLRGRGIGSALVKAAIEEAIAEGSPVVPVCPFVRDWLERHPEVEARLQPDK